jgi:Ni2+-binding GTPase involved in maturation of urease and hydrogenase
VGSETISFAQRSRGQVLNNINEIRPGIRVFETSAKIGTGMEEWLKYLEQEQHRTR